MMVATLSNPKPISKDDINNPQIRPPLLPSEKDNNNNINKKPKTRKVSSRYMSPSSSSSVSSCSISTSSSSSSSNSRRFTSPLSSRNPSPTPTPSVARGPNRSLSADRRRPVRPDLNLKTSFNNAGEVSNASKLLVTSTRRLSVSFQGEAFSIPISKTKVTPQSPSISIVRKGTPERKRNGTPLRGKVDNGGGDHVENTKPVDQQRWPGRIGGNTVLSRNSDNDCERDKINGSEDVIRALHQSMNFDSKRVSIDGRLSLDLGNAELLRPIRGILDGNFGNDSSDLTASDDTDSVSSGSTSGVQECAGLARSQSLSSAKFWQETNCGTRRLQDPGSPLFSSPDSKLIVVPRKFDNLKKIQCDSLSSSPRLLSSPSRMRSASPSKFLTSSVVSSPSKGMISPSWRNSVSSTISNNFVETPSVLSFAVDVRRGKVGENRIVDAHLLRLLYNRQLQWRFVNAKTEAALSVQKHSSEKILWNAWITVSDLHDSVTKKKHRLQLLNQRLKLASILKGQMILLEDWASLDKDVSISLVGAIEALKASTLRLPVGGGAIADIQSLKDAINSAVDVMQAMASSIWSLLSKVEDVNSMVTELAKVMAKERALLAHCKDFLSMLAAMKVKDCCLRTQMLQLNSVPST